MDLDLTEEPVGPPLPPPVERPYEASPLVPRGPPIIVPDLPDYAAGRSAAWRETHPDWQLNADDLIEVRLRLRGADLQDLALLSTKTGLSMTEALRIAIRNSTYIAMVEAHGARIVIDRDGTLTELDLLSSLEALPIAV